MDERDTWKNDPMKEDAGRETGMDAPVLRSGSAAGVRFLGYLDEPEELLRGVRRCLYGCDSADAAAYLPTESGMTLEDGSTTAAPAPWSIALVRGGDLLALGADGTWGTL